MSTEVSSSTPFELPPEPDPEQLFIEHVERVRERGDPLQAFRLLSLPHIIGRAAAAGAAAGALFEGAAPDVALPFLAATMYACATYTFIKEGKSLGSHKRDQERAYGSYRSGAQEALDEDYELWRPRMQIPGRQKEVSMWYGGWVGIKTRPDLPNMLNRLERMATLAKQTDVKEIALPEYVFQDAFRGTGVGREPDMSQDDWAWRQYAPLPKKEQTMGSVHVLPPSEWLALVESTKPDSIRSIIKRLRELSPGDPLNASTEAYEHIMSHPDDRAHRPVREYQAAKLELALRNRLLGEASSFQKRGTSTVIIGDKVIHTRDWAHRIDSIIDVAGNPTVGAAEARGADTSTKPAGDSPSDEPSDQVIHTRGLATWSDSIGEVLEITDADIRKALTESHPSDRQKAQNALFLGLYRQLRGDTTRYANTGLAETSKRRTIEFSLGKGFQRTLLEQKKTKLPHPTLRVAAGSVAVVAAFVSMNPLVNEVQAHFSNEAARVARQEATDLGMSAGSLSPTSSPVTDYLAARDPAFRVWNDFDRFKAFIGAKSNTATGGTLPDISGRVGDLVNSAASVNQLQWEITADKLTPDGYWAVNISQLLQADQGKSGTGPDLIWEPNLEYVAPTSILPVALEGQATEEPHLAVQYAQPLDPSDLAIIKAGKENDPVLPVPVRDGTVPMAASFVPIGSEQPIPLRLLSQANGTYALEFPGSAATAAGKLEYWLARPSVGSGEVVATGSIAIQGTLAEDMQQFYNVWDSYIPGLPAPTGDTVEIRAREVAAVIDTRWKYALDPYSEGELSRANSLATDAEATIDGEKANCNVEETEVALQDRQLTTVLGYEQTGNSQAKHAELWSHDAHAWAVDAQGTIIDGTPSTFASSADKAYFNPTQHVPAPEGGGTSLVPLALVGLGITATGFALANRRRLERLVLASRAAPFVMHAVVTAPVTKYRAHQYETIRDELVRTPAGDILGAVEVVEQFVYKGSDRVNIAEAHRRRDEKMQAAPDAGAVIDGTLMRRVDLTSPNLLSELSLAAGAATGELASAYRQAIQIFTQVGKMQKLSASQK
jgi:hypothetical protein